MTRPQAPATRRPREERIADIMAAASEEFRISGFEGASMASIARRANVVEGSIYRFFTHKHDLLTKVVEQWYEDMLADYARQLSCIAGTRNRLRYMIWRHLKTIHDDPEMCRLMFDHVRSAPDYRDTAVFRLNRLYTLRTLEIVQEAMAAGRVRQDLDLTMVRDFIYGGVEHRSWAYLRSEGTIDPDATADAIVDLVLHGLCARPEEAAEDLPIDRLEALATRLEAAVNGLG
ncbi:TetR/AcrR family transcriptional regulator [Chachezhania sediminis]|uniref:TetR/AcrR family transcriptional regulator n=1 Tax=Chachezhania sediminis TaxID=2599291 RepID=UPI00131E41BF|nr:TetR/AcrR family transcriptional regulator [Chachezhania sediminis]